MTEQERALLANLEALTSGEGKEKDGALYSNPNGTKFCCGEGNVRNCDGYVKCDPEPEE